MELRPNPNPYIILHGPPRRSPWRSVEAPWRPPWKFMETSMELHEDLHGVSMEAIWRSMEPPRTSTETSTDLHGDLHRASTNFHGGLHGASAEPPRTSMATSMEVRGDSVEASMELHGVQWRAPRRLMELHGAPWRSPWSGRLCRTPLLVLSYAKAACASGYTVLVLLQIFLLIYCYVVSRVHMLQLLSSYVT